MSKENFILSNRAGMADNRCAILAKNLEYLLIVKNIDTRKLSEKTGISVTNINNIRRQCANPTLETLTALAEFFNVGIAELVEKSLFESKSSLEYSLVTIPLLELNELETFIRRKSGGERIAISVPIDVSEMRRIAIKLNNNSFSPIYEKDTLFILNFELPYQDGDTAVIKLQDSPLMIRKILFSGTKVNIYYPTLLDTQPLVEDKKKVEIIGVIEKIIKER